MSEAVTSGTLGPEAVLRLRAVKEARKRLDDLELDVLKLAADAQGFRHNGHPVSFDYDLETATWTAVPAEPT